MAMTSGEFGFIRDLLRDQTGIHLEPGKEYLAEARLLPLARDEGFSSLADLIAQLRSRNLDALRRQVIEAMTTNETSFLRDFPAFEALRLEVLPDLLERRRSERRLSIWSAACSSGQEPYSLAMILADRFPDLASWSVSLLASDLSESMLERARAGRFSQLEINRGLPASLLVRHFTREGQEWIVAERLRRSIDFRRVNLAAPWPPVPKMDLILMRNVLIYLGAEARREVLRRARGALAPGGWLLLGSAESAPDDAAFERVEARGVTFYRGRR